MKKIEGEKESFTVAKRATVKKIYFTTGLGVLSFDAGSIGTFIYGF